MNSLNSVSYTEALQELGEKGMLDIAELARWLQTGVPFRPGEDIEQMLAVMREDWNARIAPSIVARGLADFFGVSYPRFGLRIYLPPPSGEVGGSFVNAIRIGSLCSEVRDWGQRDLSLPEDKRLKYMRVRNIAGGPEAVFRQGTCIGDCVIELPPRLGYQTIAREFGRACGEGRPLVGIPFVRSMTLSGLCAQAVCFMATTSMHRESKGVHGVSEITRYANNSDLLELKVAGLNLREMQHYFTNVQLAARTISFAGLDGGSKILPSGTARSCYRAAVKGCLRSGFPVIFRVDLGRMAGIHSPFLEKDPLHTQPCIFARNRLDPDRVAGRKPRSRRHAILAVGFAGDDVLFNDPAFLPFMEASFDQLLLARPYVSSKKPPLEPMNRLADCTVLPVLPPKVLLPLSNRIDDRAPGLLNFAYAVYRRLARESGLSAGHFNPGDLLLARPASDRDRIVAFCDEIFGAGAWPGDLVGKWASELGDHWIWFQAFGHEIWLWDAEFNPTKSGDVRAQANGALLLRQSWTGAEVEVTTMDERGCCDLFVQPESLSRPLHPTQEEPLPQLPGLRYGMISSFAALGMSTWARPWPGGHCNLYCFIQADGQKLLESPAKPSPAETEVFERAQRRNFWRRLSFVPKVYGPNPANWKWRQPTLGNVKPRCNVLRMLAALPKNPQEAEAHAAQVAARILDQFRDHGEVPEIAAMCSYLPEISDADQKKRERAVDALRYLMRLGAKLNEKRCEERQFTLEIVAGGLTNGIWPSKPQREAEFVMNLRSFEEALEKFIGSLELLAETWGETGVRISVECEPGPLYLLGTWDYLKRFCEAIPSGKRLSEFVGLNMDIAHWAFLKKLQPDDVPANLRDLIQSVHLSDHGDAGHFGDAMPYEIHPRGRFMDWLEFLLILPRNKFTGLVSGEFEAAASARQVTEFARRMGISSAPPGGPPPVSSPPRRP